MDWDDILQDSVKEEPIDISLDSCFRPAQTITMPSEQFELEQALISKKETKNGFSVEREYVNSKQYHDKFEQLPVNATVQQALYIQAGRLLEKVDGQEQERMVAIDARTGEFLVDNFERDGTAAGTGFTDAEYQKILDCPDSVVIMHNHSYNGRPSAQDMLTYLHDNNIRLSLIICHDGEIYDIMDVKPEMEKLYTLCLQDAKCMTSDIDEAKKLATTRLYETNDRLGKRHKLFKIQKL